MTDTEQCQPKEALTQRCQQAVQAIQNVMNTPPRDRHQIVDFGECAIVALRDCLILILRDPATGQTERMRLGAALEQVNVALSLICGVEYPGSGIQDKNLQLAREVLEGLVV